MNKSYTAILLTTLISLLTIFSCESEKKEKFPVDQITSSLKKYSQRKSPQLKDFDEVQIDSISSNNSTNYKGMLYLSAFSSTAVSSTKTRLKISYQINDKFIENPYKIQPISWVVADTISNDIKVYR